MPNETPPSPEYKELTPMDHVRLLLSHPTPELYFHKHFPRSLEKILDSDKTQIQLAFLQHLVQFPRDINGENSIAILEQPLFQRAIAIAKENLSGIQEAERQKQASIAVATSMIKPTSKPLINYTQSALPPELSQARSLISQFDLESIKEAMKAVFAYYNLMGLHSIQLKKYIDNQIEMQRNQYWSLIDQENFTHNQRITIKRFKKEKPVLTFLGYLIKSQKRDTKKFRRQTAKTKHSSFRKSEIITAMDYSSTIQAIEKLEEYLIQFTN